MTDIINQTTVELFIKLDSEFRINKVDPYTARFDSKGTLIRETIMVNDAGSAAQGTSDGVIVSHKAVGTDKLVSDLIDAAAPTKEATMREIRRCGLPWSSNLSDEFLDSILWVQDTIGLSGRNLLACMGFETGGTFDPAERNPSSSATGLIQFMDATARRLGTTTAKLALMTQVEQMNYVFKYFREFGDDLSKWDYCDTYMAILYPVAIGKPFSYPVFVTGKGPNYSPNRGLDANKDGTVTKGECCVRIKEMLDNGLKYQRKL